MRRREFFILSFLAFLWGINAQCMYTNPDTGVTYDLSPLTIMPGGVDYIFQDEVKKLTYSVNICGQSSEACNPANGMCQVNYMNSGRTLYNGCGSGNPTAITWFPYQPNPSLDGVTLLYKGGTPCPSVGVGRQTYINVLCDPGADIPVIVSVKEDESSLCSYQVNMSTSVVCQGGGKSGGGGGFDPGWAIIITAFVLIIAYLTIGVIVKYKKYEARGFELIPNIDFWKELPSLFKDGWAFFLQKVTRGKICGDYQFGG